MNDKTGSHESLMYCILSDHPAEYFFASENKDTYYKSCNYFSVKSRITKKNIYDELYGWIMWYPLFRFEPLYLSLMYDTFWFREVRNTSYETVAWSTYWPNIPDHYPMSQDEEKNVLPKEKRLWNTDNYWATKCEKLKLRKLTPYTYAEIVLDGK